MPCFYLRVLFENNENLSFQAIWLASSCQETNAISKHVFENKMFSKNIYRSGILHDPFSWKGASLTILMMNRTVTWL